MNCKAFPMGKCGFKHDENGQSNMNKFGPKRIEKDIMCKDGDNCTFNKRGICKFKHISNDKQI